MKLTIINAVGEDVINVLDMASATACVNIAAVAYMDSIDATLVDGDTTYTFDFETSAWK